MFLIVRLSRQRQFGDNQDYEKATHTLLPHLRIFKDSLDDPVAGNVPTTTFTELLLLNESISRHDLLDCLDARPEKGMEAKLCKLTCSC